MKLTYININLKRDYKKNNEYGYCFDSHAYFISHFMSMRIRQFKYVTNGQYNSIEIHMCDQEAIELMDYVKTLVVCLPFDKKRYDSIAGTDDYSYYMEILERGLAKASEFAGIPMAMFRQAIDDFERMRYRTIWDYKNLIFRDINLKLKLQALLTTNAYELTAAFETLKPRGKVLCSGLVIRTFPNYYTFKYAFQTAIHEEGKIYFLDHASRPTIFFSASEIHLGVFHFDYVDYIQGEERNACGANIKNIIYKAERFGTLEAKEP